MGRNVPKLIDGAARKPEHIAVSGSQRIDAEAAWRGAAQLRVNWSEQWLAQTGDLVCPAVVDLELSLYTHTGVPAR